MDADWVKNSVGPVTSLAREQLFQAVRKSVIDDDTARLFLQSHYQELQVAGIDVLPPVLLAFVAAEDHGGGISTVILSLRR